MRTLAQVALVAITSVASLGLGPAALAADAPGRASPKPVTLQLLSIKCNQTQDDGEDEAFLKVNGQTVI